jgi:hypothetical protein
MAVCDLAPQVLRLAVWRSKAMVRSQVSPGDRQTHVGRAMVKLGARDRAQPVVVAYQTRAGRPRPGSPEGLTSRGRRGPRQSTGTVR